MSARPLFSQRLCLRPFTADDADHLTDLDADPEVMRYLTGGLPTEREVIEREVLPLFIASHADHPLFGFWAAEHGGEFAGWFAYRPVTDDGRVASLGFRFLRRTWGRGFATEGARRLVDEGFERHRIDRVLATTYEDNLASIRVLERLGMRVNRRFRYTKSDLERADTSRPDTEDVWPGEDLEYVIERADWTSARR